MTNRYPRLSRRMKIPKWCLKYTRPTRARLAGMSCSEFKTMLKRAGYKVSREFFGIGCIATRNGRLYRFRWWSPEGFMVDCGCSKQEFDRWANSVEEVLTFDEWKQANHVR